MGKVKIGWSEIDITPDKSASLIGQFAERISEYIEKPITATALAISSKEEQMTLVSVDVNGISYNLVEEIGSYYFSNTPQEINISLVATIARMGSGRSSRRIEFAIALLDLPILCESSS